VGGSILQLKTIGISGVGLGEKEEDDDMFASTVRSSRGDTVSFEVVIVAGTLDVEAASLATLSLNGHAVVSTNKRSLTNLFSLARILPKSMRKVVDRADNINRGYSS
jgi:hypothetical protein